MIRGAWTKLRAKLTTNMRQRVAAGLVLAMLMRDLGMSKTTAGSLGTLTLLASGIGGVLFGFAAGEESDGQREGCGGVKGFLLRLAGSHNLCLILRTFCFSVFVHCAVGLDADGG